MSSRPLIYTFEDQKVARKMILSWPGLLTILRGGTIVPSASKLEKAGADTPVNDDWKWMAWFDYAALLEDKLDEEALSLLMYLIQGRTAAGDIPATDQGGVYSAWLSPDEVETLLNGVVALESQYPELLSEDTIDGFHNHFKSWLEKCIGKQLLLVTD